MKLSNILLGLVVICISIAFIQDDFINLKVKNNGKIVSMEIIDKPRSCLGTKANWLMKVKYHNKILTKKISFTFCEEHADRKSTRLNSSHRCTSRMPSSA